MGGGPGPQARAVAGAEAQSCVSGDSGRPSPPPGVQGNGLGRHLEQWMVGGGQAWLQWLVTRCWNRVPSTVTAERVMPGGLCAASCPFRSRGQSEAPGSRSPVA